MKKKKAAKKAKRSQWVVMCLGDTLDRTPWISNDVRKGTGRSSFLNKRAAIVAMKKYGSKNLLYKVVKK